MGDAEGGGIPDSNSQTAFLVSKYKKLMDRDILKRNIEDDIYKVVSGDGGGGGVAG